MAKPLWRMKGRPYKGPKGSNKGYKYGSRRPGSRSGSLGKWLKHR